MLSTCLVPVGKKQSFSPSYRFKGHQLVILTVDEENGNSGLFHALCHIGIIQIIPGNDTVYPSHGLIHGADLMIERCSGIAVGTVGNDTLHLLRAMPAHLQHRAAAYGKAVQDDFNVLSKLLLQKFDPLQAVSRLQYVEANKLSLTAAGVLYGRSRRNRFPCSCSSHSTGRRYPDGRNGSRGSQRQSFFLPHRRDSSSP